MGWIAAATGFALGQAAFAETAPPPVTPVFEVTVQAPLTAPVSGRLIVVANRPDQRFGSAPGKHYTDEEVASQLPTLLQMAGIMGMGPSPAPTTTAVTTATDVRLAAGQSIEIDRAAATYPADARYRPGYYFVQAILDVDGNYAYDNRPSPGDLVSDIIAINLPTGRTTLALNKVVQPAVHYWDQPAPTAATAPNASSAWLPQATTRYEMYQKLKADAARVEVPSAALSAFHGRAVGVRAYVLTPPGYAAGKDRYPTVFRTAGFGGTFNSTASQVEAMWQDMASGRHPPMIWVFLDHSAPTGTHEFADSANNGPWGRALTEEFIPWLDATYRTDPAARFTTGHSSGGWAALWLQVRYPKMFAGAWPTAPDPVDFHDFTNIDIYAAGANAYRNSDGAPVALQRLRKSTQTISFKSYADLEHLLGERGGQLASFEWVFSPRGADGRPVPLFDRDSGAVEPVVAAYWRDNYDITHIIRRDWRRLKPDLDGKIHLWVGTLDTYHLEGAAYLLKASLDELGAKSDFHFIEGADHGSFTVNISPKGSVDFGALERRLAWEMYRQARPASPLREAEITATASR